MSASDIRAGGIELVRCDVVDGDREVAAGESATIMLEVTNTDTVIRMFRVSLLGMDETNVVFEPPIVALFPGEREQVTAIVTPPDEHPAGRHVLVFEVADARSEGPAIPALADFALDVTGRPSMTLSAEPSTLETGSKGAFVVHLVNTGNMPLDVAIVAQDAERLVEVEFEPPRPTIEPGQRAVVRGMARGPRPWFGTPAVRVLDVTATAQDVVAVTALAMLQRARIGRRLIAMLGLLLVVSLFAFVIRVSFERVAELSAQNAELVQQGLGVSDEAVARAEPAGLSGLVSSSTGEGIGGAAVRLYEEANPGQAVQTTVSDDDATFSFPTVADGAYLLQAEAAGFGAVWFPASIDVDNATPVEIVDGEPVDGLEFLLTGRPGLVEGTVVGRDVAEAMVTVRIPADGVRGSQLDPVASVVATVAVDETGVFVLADLATPATYEIAVSKDGFATSRRTISLDAGEQRENIEILLRRGIGVISGRVVDGAGVGIGGVDVLATDGTSEAITRSRSVDGEAGQFELRDLEVPATYTITFTRPGFFTETVTIGLEEGQAQVEREIVVTRDSGRLSGVVRDRSGEPIGGVTITVVGAEVEVVTESLTQAAGEGEPVGSWLVDALPVPATYTVSFSAPGYRTTAVTVELLSGAQGGTRTADAVLVEATGLISGRVTDTSGEPIPDVQVTLESAEVSRATVTSHFPAGRYRFDRVPPGAYTLTFSRAGSSPQTLLVDLGPGEQEQVPDVRLEAQAVLTGTVTRNGQPAAGTGVVVYRSRNYPEEMVAEVVTDESGAFTVLGLDAPEAYVVDFHVPAGGPVVGSREVFVQPDDTTTLNADL